MSAVLAAGGLDCHLLSGCGFPAPGAEIFVFQDIFTFTLFQLEFGISKVHILLFLGVAIIVGFFSYAFRRPKLVPRGAQNVGELGYLFIRDGIAKETIGHGGEKFVPFGLTLFFFILCCNLWGLIPYGATATGNISVTATLAIMTA